MDKIIAVKLFNFELKLTNVKKLDYRDFAICFLLGIWITSFTWAYWCYPILILAFYFYPCTFFFVLPYFIWLYLDRNTPHMGGRESRSAFHDSKLLKSLAQYYPIRLIKTADLPPDKNYIFGCFPHGVIPISTFANFMTNANNCDQLFPGISMHDLAHPFFFYIPFLRELYMSGGACPCSESGMKYLLNSKPSKAVIACPGGTTEMRLSKPGNIYKSIAKRRKGFVRVAIQTGASLVPVFTFGEINLWNAHYILEGLGKRLYGLDFVVLNGRGFFQHHFGFLPHWTPIKTVVGKPISVPKVENPSIELINEYHEKFLTALHDLFEEHKAEYNTAEGEAKLVMI